MLLALASVASAATFTVNSYDDTHDFSPGDAVCEDAVWGCSLRAAIEEANAWPGDDTIDLTGITGTLYVGGTGDPSIDDEPLLITSSMHLVGDATGIYRYVTGDHQLPSDTPLPLTVSDGATFAVLNGYPTAGVAVDVGFESLWLSTDTGTGTGIVSYSDAGTTGGSLSLDRVDAVYLDTGVRVTSFVGPRTEPPTRPGQVRVGDSLFFGNRIGVQADGYVEITGSLFQDNESGVRATGGADGEPTPGRYVENDFVGNSEVGLAVGSASTSEVSPPLLFGNTFVDNNIGVSGRVSAIVSSFAGNRVHLLNGSASTLSNVTFGPNDGTCEPPVRGDEIVSTASIFTAPACGTAASCEGSLFGGPRQFNLVEDQGDPAAPACALRGAGSWLAGELGSPLDAELDGLESHRSFTSATFGTFDVGEAYPLLPGSPAIDAGGPALRRPDLAGNYFNADGDGDRRRARDLGALEYVP